MTLQKAIAAGNIVVQFFNFLPPSMRKFLGSCLEDEPKKAMLTARAIVASAIEFTAGESELVLFNGITQSFIAEVLIGHVATDGLRKGNEQEECIMAKMVIS
jgi:hypothetical protein